MNLYKASDIFGICYTLVDASTQNIKVMMIKIQTNTSYVK